MIFFKDSALYYLHLSFREEKQVVSMTRPVPLSAFPRTTCCFWPALAERLLKVRLILCSDINRVSMRVLNTRVRGRRWPQRKLYSLPVPDGGRFLAATQC